MRIFTSPLLVWSFWLSCVVTASAAPAQVWRMVSPSLPVDRLNAVTHGNGKFVAVGDAGLVMTSSNGVVWKESRVENSIRWRTVLAAAGRFIIAGDSGKIYWSDDAEVWTPAEAPALPNHSVTAIEFGDGEDLGGGLFVAMASITSSLAPPFKTVSLLSSNGIHWVTNSIGGDYMRESGYSKIVFANGRFVAAQNYASSSSSRPIVSVNGTNWSYASGAGNGSLTYGNGIFVAAKLHQDTGSGLKLFSATSVDGVVWLPVINFSGASNPVYDACFGGGKFVAVSQLGTADVSEDGTNWVTHQAGIDGALRGVTFADGLYVAVGDGGSIFTSVDAIEWKRQGAGTSRNLIGAGPYNENGFVAVGNGGSIIWSPDGVIWNATNSPTTNALQSFIQRNGRLICVGQEGTILEGPEPGSLDVMSSGTALSLRDIAYGVNKYVVVGQSGALLTSENGRDWLVGNSGVTNNLSALAFGGGRFVAVGETGLVVSSTDGVIWVVQSSGTTRSFSDIVYGRGIFVAAAPRQSPGSGTYVMVSTDGVTWETSDAFISLVSSSVSYGSGYFVLPYSSGAFWVSSNGKYWESVNTIGSAPFLQSALVYNNGVFVTAGRMGMVFQSEPVIRLEVLSESPVSLGVEGPKNRSYRIESRDELLESGPWDEVGVISSAPNSLIDPRVPPATGRYYRAVMLP